MLKTEASMHGQQKGKPVRQQYHVTKTIVVGLARSENRTYSTAEEDTKAYETAEVVLAFPVSDQSEPVIDSQEVFAFLPVRRVGFNVCLNSQSNIGQLADHGPRSSSSTATS